MKCDDENCPKHGSLKVYSGTIEGVVVSDKPKNTIIIERDYLYYVPKYERYERRKSRISAHKPPCMNIHTGDMVIIGKCRKVSKTKAHVVLEKIE